MEEPMCTRCRHAWKDHRDGVGRCRSGKYVPSGERARKWTTCSCTGYAAAVAATPA